MLCVFGVNSCVFVVRLLCVGFPFYVSYVLVVIVCFCLQDFIVLFVVLRCFLLFVALFVRWYVSCFPHGLFVCGFGLVYVCPCLKLCAFSCWLGGSVPCLYVCQCFAVCAADAFVCFVCYVCVYIFFPCLCL